MHIPLFLMNSHCGTNRELMAVLSSKKFASCLIVVIWKGSAANAVRISGSATSLAFSKPSKVLDSVIWTVASLLPCSVDFAL